MSDRPARFRRPARWALALFMTAAGLNHFLNPTAYLAVMPPYLPAHRTLVALSGILEIGGGLAVLAPAWQRAAGWFLSVLLVAILPANVHMAMTPELFPSIPVWALYLRLPLQGVLVLWVLWATGILGSTPQAERS